MLCLSPSFYQLSERVPYQHQMWRQLKVLMNWAPSYLLQSINPHTFGKPSTSVDHQASISPTIQHSTLVNHVTPGSLFRRWVFLPDYAETSSTRPHIAPLCYTAQLELCRLTQQLNITDLGVCFATKSKMFYKVTVIHPFTNLSIGTNQIILSQQLELEVNTLVAQLTWDSVLWPMGKGCWMERGFVSQKTSQWNTLKYKVRYCTWQHANETRWRVWNKCTWFAMILQLHASLHCVDRRIVSKIRGLYKCICTNSDEFPRRWHQSCSGQISLYGSDNLREHFRYYAMDSSREAGFRDKFA